MCIYYVCQALHILLKSSQQPMQLLLITSPILLRGTEKLGYLPKVIQVRMEELGVREPGQSGSTALT